MAEKMMDERRLVEKSPPGHTVRGEAPRPPAAEPRLNLSRAADESCPLTITFQPSLAA